MRAALIGLCLFAIDCELVTYSPNAPHVPKRHQETTARNLERLAQQEPGEVVRIAMTSDPQLNLDRLREFVDAVNARDDIDLVLVSGDINQYGILDEYIWTKEILENLEVPWFTAVGNHDVQGNGHLIYAQMYGPTDYAFVYGGFKFVVIDNNMREEGYGGSPPPIEWLREELAPSDEFREAVLIAHVPPQSSSFFDEQFKLYSKVLRESGTVRLSLHGHIHRHEIAQDYGDGIKYVVADDTGDRNYLEITLSEDGHAIEPVHF